MRFILLFLLALMISSCSDIEKDEQLKKIGVLNTTIDSLKSTLVDNKIENVAKKKLAFYTVIKRIKSYYYTDTIDHQFAKKMESYKLIQKSLKNLDGDYEKIRTALEEEKLSLNKLNSDVRKGFGKREKYDEYISFEKNKIKKIKSLMKEYKSKKEEFTISFDSLHPLLNDYSIRLEEKFKTKEK
jgi:hypothetical protein